MELSLLLAFTAVGSSFSHIVLISVLRLRCGCVKAAGGSEGLSAAQLWIQTPHVIKGHISVISLAHASPLSPPLFSISCPVSLSLSSPLFLALLSFPAGRPLCLGSGGPSCHFCFSHPPLPRAIVADPSFVCVLRLLLKIKNSPFHPLYCFLVGCPCHSLGFYVLAGYPSSFPLQRLAMLSAFSHFFFFFSEGE